MATHSALAGRTLAPEVALFVSCFALSCGSGAAPAEDGKSTPPPTRDAGAGVPADPGGADGSSATGASGSIVETGVMVDYETLTPVAGLTVTDNGVSATTDSNGAFSLTVPPSVTLLGPTVTGPQYSMLLFPFHTPTGGPVDYGTNVIPDSMTYALEQTVLQNDQTKALVQLVVQVTGACKSAVGGTVQVLSPAGTSASYFSTSNIPQASLTSFQAVQTPRPVAVVYDIPVGSELTLAVTHPTCTLVPFPVATSGKLETGQVTTKATEPGDVNGALVLTLQ